MVFSREPSGPALTQMLSHKLMQAISLLTFLSTALNRMRKRTAYLHLLYPFPCLRLPVTGLFATLTIDPCEVPVADRIAMSIPLLLPSQAILASSLVVLSL